MGWLLTLLLAVPQVDGPVHVEMWFSRESYCTFARNKFTEQPMFSLSEDGPRVPIKIKDSGCRELGPKEADRIPPHMRDRYAAQPEVNSGF